MDAATLDALSSDVVSGATVLCLLPCAALVEGLQRAAGPMGVVIVAAARPPRTAQAVRCDPDVALPLRSHVIDLALVDALTMTPVRVDEIRRALAPRAEARILVVGHRDGALQMLWDAGLIARHVLQLDHDSRIVFARGP